MHFEVLYPRLYTHAMKVTPKINSCIMINAIFSLVSVVMVNISKFTVKDGGCPLGEHEPYHGGTSANG